MIGPAALMGGGGGMAPNLGGSAGPATSGFQSMDNRSPVTVINGGAEGNITNILRMVGEITGNNSGSVAAGEVSGINNSFSKGWEPPKGISVNTMLITGAILAVGLIAVVSLRA